MPYLIAFVVGLFLLYLAVWLVVAGFMWLLLPALCIAVPVAAVVGALLGLTVTVLTLTGLWKPPRTITPDRVTGPGSELGARRGDNPFGRDWAWPSYLAAQGKVDLAQVWRANVGLLGDGWRWIDRVLQGGPGGFVKVLAGWPIWLGVSVGALVADAVVVGACGLLLGVLWVGWAVPVGLLRAGDQLVRSVRKAVASCPHCYYVTSLPAFACPGCGRLHRDVRPGRLGGLRRRCGCDESFPTTVLLVARKMVPRCPRCEVSLRDGSAVLKDIRLPVFGPVSAGKTRMVYSGLLALRDAVAEDGGTVDFVDEDSRAAFDNAVALVQPYKRTTKTLAGELPHAITVRCTVGRRRALLHLFDAAGEFYTDRDDNAELEFLDHAQGLVLVIDPFSIPWVRERGGAGFEKVAATANPATADAEETYQITASRLRDYGVRTHRRRLAVAVVKVDLLAELPTVDNPSPAHVRDWLRNAGLDNLVDSAERDFGTVRYFAVASNSGRPVTDALSPAGPLGWVVAGSGLRLWPGCDVVAGESDERRGAGPAQPVDERETT